MAASPTDLGSRSFFSRFKSRKDTSTHRHGDSLEVPTSSVGPIPIVVDTKLARHRSHKGDSPCPSPALSDEQRSQSSKPGSLKDKHLSVAESKQDKRTSLSHPHIIDVNLDSQRQHQRTKDIQKTLLSRSSLRKCLDNPTALHKFGAFLAQELGAEHLVFWLNAQQHANDLARLLQLSRRIYDLHCPETAPLALNITNEERTDLEEIHKHWMTVQDPFKAAKDRAFDSLLADAWPRFILHRVNLLQKSLISNKDSSAAPLDSFALAEVSSGNDQPLVMLSKGFEELTGYTIQEVIGTNCRFLQGPGTSKTAVARIRTACSLGLPAQEMLLNHRKDGTPYWVLLRIEPLRDFRGQLKYMLAHQFNMTRYSTDLGWLLSDAIEPEGTDSDSPMVTMQQKRVDLAVKKHLCTQYENPCDHNNHQSHKEAQAEIDRDQRLKDAAALAAVDAESQSQRPRSAHRNRAGSVTPVSGNSPQPQQVQKSSNAPASSSNPARSGRPTSAGSAAPAFGKASSRQERRAISSLAQIEDTEEDAEWQSRAMAHFVFLEPGSGKIRFSSPKLPVEWAAGTCFFTILEKTNPLYVVNNLKKLMKAGNHFEIEATLHLFKRAERPSSEGRVVSLSVTPLLEANGAVAGIVCLFGV